MIAAWQHYRMPRQLHPGAWWLWALGLAVASANTTNPVLLCLLVSLVALVVSLRRSEAPWALSFRMYLLLGLFIVLMRTAFRIIFSGNGATILFTIPFPALPDWIADQGGHLFGAISAEALLSGFYDGLKLAAMVICVGAANSLANPKRLLAGVPAALYELGSVIVVAVSVFPQLAESVRRVERARRFRNDSKGRRHWLRQVLMPVFVDALDRSILLAASMDSRGYGQQAVRSKTSRALTSALLLAAMMLLCVAGYALFDPASFGAAGLPLLFIAVLLAAVALIFAGRRSVHTRYRPDTWGLTESLVAASGLVVALGFIQVAQSDPDAAFTSVYPPQWPLVSLLSVAACFASVLPILFAPPSAASATVASAASRALIWQHTPGATQVIRESDSPICHSGECQNPTQCRQADCVCVSFPGRFSDGSGVASGFYSAQRCCAFDTFNRFYSEKTKVFYCARLNHVWHKARMTKYRYATPACEWTSDPHGASTGAAQFIRQNTLLLREIGE